MTDLHAPLQSTLGDGYTVDRALGGAGMPRVFVAREHALSRDGGAPTVVHVCAEATPDEVGHRPCDDRLSASLAASEIPRCGNARRAQARLESCRVA